MRAAAGRRSARGPGDFPAGGNRRLHWVVYSGASDNARMLRSFFAEQGQGGPNVVARSTSFATGLSLVREVGLKMVAPLQLASLAAPSGFRAIPTTTPMSRLAAGAYLRNSSLRIPVVQALIEDLRKVAGAETAAQNAAIAVG